MTNEKELDKAAEKYVDEECSSCDYIGAAAAEKAFKAGAKWQAQHSSSQEDVDLEKEIDAFYGMYRDENGETHDIEDGGYCTDWKEDCNPDFEIKFVRYFYELGKKSK